MSTPLAEPTPDELPARRQELAQAQSALPGVKALQPAQRVDPLQAVEELREAIEELRRRQDAYEPQLQELAGEVAAAGGELAVTREFRQWAEHELSAVRMSCAALAAVVDEMAQLPAELRAEFEPELAQVQRELLRQGAIAGQQSLLLEAPSSAAGVRGEDAPGSSLRARPPAAAARPETSLPAEAGTAQEPESPSVAGGSQRQGMMAPALPVPPDALPEAARPLRPSPFRQPEQPVSWLAPAIRRLAERRSGKLAAELIAELMPLRGRLLEPPVRYGVEIEELGRFVVEVDAHGATFQARQPDEEATSLAFRLAGPAAAFATLAAGGATRRPWGLKVRGSRRMAKRLFRACERPCALVDLVDVSVPVWPGLLLAAMSEAIDPAWTIGATFLVAYVIQGPPSATIYVQVADGEPIGLDTTADPGSHPQASVYLSERAFLCMLAGAPLPDDEQIMLSGHAEPAHMLCGWFARAQGLIAAT